MIRQFEEWTAGFAEKAQLDSLTGSIVGIEASDYLNRLQKFPVPNIDRPIKESLVPALGPIPFGLRSVVRNTIAVWKSYGITPYFIFSGLDVGKRDTSFAASEEAARINNQAWSLYYSNDASTSVNTFGKSEAVTSEDLFRYLQKVLREEDVNFLVAPYGAWAQLSYLYKNQSVDAIFGSSEILLFDVPEVITSWDFKAGEFTWVKRQACIKDVGAVSSDVLIDACLLAGTSFLPTLPALEATPARKQLKVKAATEMIMASMGRTGHSVCIHHQEDPAFQHLNYLDRFRKARLAVKHHVVLTSDGKVEPFDVEHAPFDIHEFIGQRLPEELYFYLSKGVISPRVLNWITSSEIIELPPLDNGDSEDYKRLVKDQLNEIRSTSISLLSTSLARFFKYKDVNLRCWFDKTNVKVISMRDLDDPLPLVKEWNVHEDVYGPEKNKHQGSGLLGIAVKSLSSSDFCKNSIGKSNPSNPLKTKEEILFNSVWRLLHLRGYVGKDHTLTAWGKVLYEAIAALPSLPSDQSSIIVELEEAVFVAVELARLGLLNARNMHPDYSGAPYRGKDVDKSATMLISRVAILGNLAHKEIGYTGPLSRNYLGYHSMTTAVRASLRDLAEVCLTSLLLNGDADRERNDYHELGLDLPFIIQNTCALGIAVNTYLDAMAVEENPSASETKAAVRKRTEETIFIYADDYTGDVNKAFQLWDANYAGIKVSDNLVKDRKSFDEADAWLKIIR